ncbi:hypothetical protein PVAG01_05153 [Phlyctema vagabunda]|uniref:Clr5 domain-containing protein n=1 Tax=Phlyctema vagabunda TaxID=108571 RepID=A0ABR4PJ88_9HELO
MGHMAPNLRPEVIAAIETAVELNDGRLESAFIHSLAKIYKTSPQAIVWNMKRYNKVKAGMDDRKKTGRRAAMNKDEAAEHAREILAQNPGMKYDNIVDALFERFEIRVSTTWVSRLLKNYKIAHEKPPSITPRRELKRIPSKGPVLEDHVIQDNPNQVCSPPRPINYPTFRQDLQQALAPPPLSSYQPSSRPAPQQPTSSLLYGGYSLANSAAERQKIPSMADTRTLPAPASRPRVSDVVSCPPDNSTAAPTINTVNARKSAPQQRAFVWKVVSMVEQSR